MLWHGGLLPSGALSADCCLHTADGGEFRVQRGYLRAASAYFCALLGEDNGYPRDVLVSGVTSSVLDILLTFLYTDNLFVSPRNVLEVLQAADMLLLDAPREQCLQILLHSLAPENCLVLARMTARYKDPKFKATVMAYALEHFNQVWRRTEEFGKTPAWLLCDLLASPELSLEREEDALEAIAIWLAAAGGENGSKLRDLLQCVRVGRCEPETLDSFRKRWPVLTERADFTALITDALKLGPCKCSRDPVLLKLLELEQTPPETPQANLVSNPVLSSAPSLDATGEVQAVLNDIITAAAALRDAAVEAANSVALATGTTPEAGDAALADKVQKPADLTTFMHPTQAVCDTCGLANPERWIPRLPTELIFLVGGWSNGQAKSTIQTYDTTVGHWFQFQNKDLKPRAYHGVVQWRRQLFVLGGLKLKTYMRLVDSFDLDTCEWESHSPMLVTRAYVATAALGEHIYVIGGHTGVERTSTVERYEPLRNQWIMVAEMWKRRSDASACVFKGRVFVSGGFSGSRLLESVEVYSPSDDAWNLVQPLPSPRCGHRMVVHCGRLYVIGGFDGKHRLNNVLRSDDSLPLHWSQAPSLTIPRSTFAVATLGDHICVIGGFNGTSLVSSVERYTPADQSWREGKPLYTPVAGLSGCTVRGVQVCRKFSLRGAAVFVDI